MTDHREMKPPSLWRKEPDEVKLLLLGKLAEEASELAARASRCVIQGLDALDPKTGRSNREELQDEIADVRAMMNLTRSSLDLDLDAIDERVSAKAHHKGLWLAMVRQAVDIEAHGFPLTTISVPRDAGVCAKAIDDLVDNIAARAEAPRPQGDFALLAARGIQTAGAVARAQGWKAIEGQDHVWHDHEGRMVFFLWGLDFLRIARVGARLYLGSGWADASDAWGQGSILILAKERDLDVWSVGMSPDKRYQVAPSSLADQEPFRG